MVKYSTISVPEDVKRLLEKEKGGREWGEFLLSLYEDVKKLRAREAFRRLTESLTDEELEDILRSSREFRESFRFR
ncbi:MAG: antitoxin VapB family protein [Candidatus Jordarchaeales archaeon]